MDIEYFYKSQTNSKWIWRFSKVFETENTSEPPKHNCTKPPVQTYVQAKELKLATIKQQENTPSQWERKTSEPAKGKVLTLVNRKKEIVKVKNKKQVEGRKEIISTVPKFYAGS